MYEVWLALNIVWETALGIWPWLLLIGAVWLALLVRGSRRAVLWMSGFRPALWVAVAVAVLAFLLVPWLTASSLSELRYWVDVVALAAISIGLGALAGLLAWPLCASKVRAS